MPARTRFFWVLPTIALLYACATPPPAPVAAEKKTVATVNGERITERDYASFVALRTHAIKDGTPRDVILTDLIHRVLLAQLAVQQGLDKTDTVKTQLKYCNPTIPPGDPNLGRNLDPETYLMMRTKRCHETVLARAYILNGPPVTDADLRVRFEQELSNTHATEYKVRHILVKTEEQAKEIKERLASRTTFAELAKEYSIDLANKDEGGDLGWINQGMVTKEFFDPVTRMKKGEISNPVKTEYGWHIIRLDNSRALRLPTFEEYVADPNGRAALVRFVYDERIAAMLENLTRAAKITRE